MGLDELAEKWSTAIDDLTVAVGLPEWDKLACRVNEFMARAQHAALTAAEGRSGAQNGPPDWRQTEAEALAAQREAGRLAAGMSSGEFDELLARIDNELGVLDVVSLTRYRQFGDVLALGTLPAGYPTKTEGPCCQLWWQRVGKLLTGGPAVVRGLLQRRGQLDRSGASLPTVLWHGGTVQITWGGDVAQRAVYCDDSDILTTAAGLTDVAALRRHVFTAQTARARYVLGVARGGRVGPYEVLAAVAEIPMDQWASVTFHVLRPKLEWRERLDAEGIPWKVTHQDTHGRLCAIGRRIYS